MHIKSSHCTLRICALLFVSYASIKLEKIKKKQSMTSTPETPVSSSSSLTQEWALSQFLSSMVTLPVLDLHVNGTIEDWLFCAWIPLPNMMHASFIQVVMCCSLIILIGE